MVVLLQKAMGALSGPPQLFLQDWICLLQMLARVPASRLVIFQTVVSAAAVAATAMEMAMKEVAALKRFIIDFEKSSEKGK